MEDNSIFLVIEVKYEEDVYEIKLEEAIKYEELVKRVIEHFNIDEDKKDYLEFKYIDEDGDLNILGYDNDIFDISKENLDGEYSLKLDLFISGYKNTRNELRKNLFKENIINLKEENKIIEKEDNNNKNININEDVNNIKKRYKKQLKLLNDIYKNEIENIKNDIINIINKKYKIIKKEIIKSNIDIEKEHLNFDNQIIIKNNNKNLFNNESSSDSDDKIDISNNLIESEQKEEIYNDFIIYDKNKNNNDIELQLKENTNNKQRESLFKKSINKIGQKINNINKITENFNSLKKNLKPTKEALNTLYKKYRENEVLFTKKGNEIDNNLKKYKFNRTDMNKFYIKYINDKNKDNKMKSKDILDYYIILKKMNYYLENKKINHIVDEYFNYVGEYNPVKFELNITKDLEDYQKHIIQHLKNKINF